MCYTCGCMIPDDNMGHPENITDETFEKAAKVEDITPEEAKKNSLKLLKKQLGEKE